MEFSMPEVSLVYMSRNSIHISIPKPCHESWDGMATTMQGAFCHSCQKEVIDFSAMTDREVVEYLTKHKTDCGRFRKDQLDTKLIIPQIDNGFMKWKALFLGILPFISLKAAFTSAPDQGTKLQTQQKATEKKSIPAKLTVTGNISTEAGDPINEAVVEVVDSAGAYIGPSAMVNEKGFFSMELDGRAIQCHGAKLKVEAAAYKGYRSEIQILSYEPVQQYSICLSSRMVEVKAIKEPIIDNFITGAKVMRVEPVKMDTPLHARILERAIEYVSPKKINNK